MILLLVVFAGLIFFMFRSNRKRQKQQAELQESLKPGTEIMTSAGFYGTIIRVDTAENKVWIESTPGTILVIHPQAIGRVIPPTATAADEVSQPIETTSEEATTAVDTGKPAFGERVENEDEPATAETDTTADDATTIAESTDGSSKN